MNCPHRLEKNWIWDRAQDTRLADLASSGAVYVVEVYMTLTEPLGDVQMAVGFSDSEQALDFLAWMYRHYLEEHGATAIDGCICGVEEYIEGDNQGLWDLGADLGAG